MSKQNKRKLGYKQFEKLLALAHQKSDILAERCKELQTYFMAYVEYRGDNIQFNNWIDEKAKKMQAEAHKNRQEKEQINEKV